MLNVQPQTVIGPRAIRRTIYYTFDVFYVS